VIFIILDDAFLRHGVGTLNVWIRMLSLTSMSRQSF